ncbi:MAG: hypothetical protein ACOYJ2_07750 [Rickettsiales bacterium]
MSHLNPDSTGKGQIDEYIRWLKKNADPKTTEIALVGGTDKGERAYLQFPNSADLVEHLKSKLTKAGYNIVFEELYGKRIRDVTLTRDGIISVTDQHDANYHRSFTFSQHAESRDGGRPR